MPGMKSLSIGLTKFSKSLTDSSRIIEEVQLISSVITVILLE